MVKLNMLHGYSFNADVIIFVVVIVIYGYYIDSSVQLLLCKMVFVFMNMQ